MSRRVTRSVSAGLASLCLLATLLGCDNDSNRNLPADAGPDAPVDPGRPDFGPPPDPPVDNAVGNLIDDFPGEVAYYVRDLENGDAVGWRSDVRVAAGDQSALLAVLVYASQVDSGTLTPDQEVQLRPTDTRGVGLGADRAGEGFDLGELAERAVTGDRTAEQLLVNAVGGPDAVNAVTVGLGIDGLGRYLDPCERDRLYADALDPRFAEADCAAVADWVHRGEAAGITPLPFAQPPQFDNAQRASAAEARLATGAGTITARDWGRLLARLDAGTLLDPSVDQRVRALLDAGRARGEGDDGIPAEGWAGGVVGRTIDGRSWTGRIRGGSDPMVAVCLTSGIAPDDAVLADVLCESLVAEGWRVVLGPRGAWPPEVAPNRPDAVVDVLLSDTAGEDACLDTGGGFDDQVQCRRDAAVATFSPGDDVVGHLLMQGPDGGEVSWIWTGPDGARTRTQIQLGPSAWWVWTERHPVFTIGTWTLVVALDGVVIQSRGFDVSE